MLFVELNNVSNLFKEDLDTLAAQNLLDQSLLTILEPLLRFPSFLREYMQLAPSQLAFRQHWQP